MVKTEKTHYILCTTVTPLGDPIKLIIKSTMHDAKADVKTLMRSMFCLNYRWPSTEIAIKRTTAKAAKVATPVSSQGSNLKHCDWAWIV